MARAPRVPVSSFEYTEGWKLVEDPKRGLPEGRFEFLVVELNNKLVLQTAYIYVPSRGDRAARTRSFDDGTVVVEYSEKDEVSGIELLSLATGGELPEFSSYLDENHDPVLWAGYATIVSNWPIIEILCSCIVRATLENFAQAVAIIEATIREDWPGRVDWKEDALVEGHLVEA